MFITSLFSPKMAAQTVARKRMISPEIWTDEDFCALTRDERLFFIGVFSNSDDHGRIIWQSRSLLGSVFPFDDDLNYQKLEVFMARLTELGMVHVYDGRYAHIPSWLKHQTPSHPAESKIPTPTCLKCDLKPSRKSVEEFKSASRKLHPQVRLGKVRLGKVRLGLGDEVAPSDGTIHETEFGAAEADVVLHLTLAAGENKTASLAEPRAQGIRAVLRGIREECGDLAVFQAGLREANAKGKPNPNYVRACVRSALERAGAGSMPKRREPKKPDWQDEFYAGLPTGKES